MYDWKFILTYLEKADPFHKEISSFLPPLEERELIGAQRFPSKDDKRAERKFEGDPWMLKMEQLFIEWYGKQRYDEWFEEWGGQYAHLNLMGEDAEKLFTRFYNTMMYEKRCVKVEKDPRRVKNNVVAIMKFVSKFADDFHARGIKTEGEPTEKERKWWEWHLNDVK